MIKHSFIVGVLYGTTSVAVGHPFDTIKTKMQAQHGFENEGMIRSFAKTVKTQGIRGLYRLASVVLSLFSSERKLLFWTVHTLACTVDGL